MRSPMRLWRAIWTGFLAFFSSLPNNIRGMLAMTVASVIFVFSDVVAKLATQFWPVAQMLTVRGVFALALGFAIVLAMGERAKLPMLGRPMMVARSLTEGLVSLLFMSALARMPIADLTSILMLAPAMIAALATVFFGEVVGWRRWSAIVVGFLGLLLVVQPGGVASARPGYAFAASLGLASVFGVAVRDILTRRLGAEIPSVVITLGTAFGSFAAGLALSTVEPWRDFSWMPVLYCALASALVTAGNFALILASRDVDLSAVAPYRYTAVIWSIGLGIIVFGEYPGRLALVGIAVIVASGLYLMHRERVKGARSAAPVPPG